MSQEPEKIVFRSPEEIARYNAAEHKRIATELFLKGRPPAIFTANQLPKFAQHKGWCGVFQQLIDRLGYQIAGGTTPGAILVLCGPRGCGKTAMATEAMRSFALLHWSVLFSSALSMIERARLKNADWFEDFEDPKLLVLDEAAKAGEGAREEIQFSNLINTRVLAGRHTILTCAVSPPELSQVLPPSIIDRINQPPSMAFHLDWPSFRVAS